MVAIRENASKVLEMAKSIYLIEENTNSNVIFGDKTFLIGTEYNPEDIIVQRNYEKKDRSYYFETSEIEGIIIKRGNDDFCIKACVSYENANNQKLYFAKIRIEKSYEGDIKIMGTWGGSWQQSDAEDKDQFKNPDADFPFALEAMKNHLADIYMQLSENFESNKDLYNPEWVRRLKQYNK